MSDLALVYAFGMGGTSWLAAPAVAVFADIQGDDPIPDLWVVVKALADPVRWFWG